MTIVLFSVRHTTRDQVSTNSETEDESDRKYHYVTDEAFEKIRFKVILLEWVFYTRKIFVHRGSWVSSSRSIKKR